LEKDYAGEDRGVIADRVERERSEKKANDIYLPAGSKGPSDRMGGAADRAPEPIRTPPESREQARRPKREEAPLTAPEGAPIDAPEPEEEADDAVADAAPPSPVEEEEADDNDAPPPAEQDEGWGIPDWYDEE